MTQEEMQQTQSTAEAKTPTAREAFMADWSGDNPDIDTADEEAMYAKMHEDYKSGRERKKREDRFNAIMEQNNYAPEVMDAIMTGIGPDGQALNLIKFLAGDHRKELQAALNGDEEALAWLAEERAKEIADEATAAAEKKAKDDELVAAVAAEDEALAKALKAAGKTEKDFEKMADWLYNKDTGLIVRAMRFELTEEDFGQLIKLADYDKNISAATEEGYRRGKNEKVDIYADLEDPGNGKPTNLGGGAGKPARKAEENPTLSALDRMGSAYGV